MENAPVITSSGKSLPSYRSHKIVRAAKIKQIVDRTDKPSDGKVLIFDDSELGLVNVSEAYVAKHEPQEGGYFVEYENGYHSWSPADVFEAGNSLIDDEDVPAKKVAKKAAKKSAQKK